MIEIRFHGRGGQGMVIASQLLAEALFLEGKHVQSFAMFGIERRGAPVVAFLRADDKEINSRYQIYSPDYVVVVDPSLIGKINIAAGLKEGRMVLINTPRSAEDFKNLGDFKIATIDASAIAIKNRLGAKTAPIVNTTILGAFSKATKIVRLESIIKAIEDSSLPYPERNIAAAKEAYNSALSLATGEKKEEKKASPKISPAEILEIAVSKTSTLNNKTGSWRNQKPLIDQKLCNRCGVCEIFCPDLVIFVAEDGHYEINYDYCKGCGICQEVCPKKAISMETEVK